MKSKNNLYFYNRTKFPFLYALNQSTDTRIAFLLLSHDFNAFA